MQKNTDENRSKPTLNWDDVRFFIELARQGSLSGTARALRVEHSTVARRISGLEASTGVRLFDRMARGWVLTQEGEALLEQAKRMETEALGFGRALMGASELRGRVRLSAPPVIAAYWLVPRLASFHERYPAITLELVGENREADLNRREADLAMRFDRPEAPGLAARPLATFEFGLYGRPEVVERDEREWCFLGYDSSLSQTPQQRWLDDLAGGRPFSLRSNDLNVLFLACRAGRGLAVLPHFLGREHPDLIEVSHYPCPVSRTAWLVVHPDVRRSPRVQALAEALRALVKDGASAGD